MSFTLIKGTFHVAGYSPDGDSIRFQPANQALITGLQNGQRARFNARGHVQLRIEAIDTLETHFSPPGGGSPSLHQPHTLAQAATDALLEYLGIRDVVWDSQHRNVISAADGMPGYILARSVERNGRPVAFVFAGEAEEADGTGVFFGTERLQASYNWTAAASGLAYLTFYKGLFHDIRDALAAVAGQARAERRGVYAEDGTQTGFTPSSLAVITDEVPILPKLFRRLSDFMVNTGSASGFKEAMRESREPVLDLLTSNFTHFDTFIEQDAASGRILLTRLPEQLVFDETIPQPGPVFAEVFNAAPAFHWANAATANV